MDIIQAKKLTTKIFKMDLESKVNFTPMLWGPPGVGKSDIIAQIAEELGFELRVIKLSTLSPVDVRGLPHIDPREPDKFRFVPANFIPDGKEEKNVLLFFDEVNTAPPINQTTAYEIALERSVGGHKLPEGTLVCMAGNRAEDLGATYEMPMPLANRLAHINIEKNADAFVKYALNNNYDDSIIAFIKTNMQYIHAMPKSGKYAYPSPRTWSFVDALIKHNGGRAENTPVSEIGAFIGDEIAHDFHVFISYKDILPDLDVVLSTGKPFTHEERSVMFFYVVSLSLRLKKLFNENSNEKLIKNYINALMDVDGETKMLAIMCVREEFEIFRMLLSEDVFFDSLDVDVNEL